MAMIDYTSNKVFAHAIAMNRCTRSTYEGKTIEIMIQTKQLFIKLDIKVSN
jgi:hypothetical protein